MCKKLYSGKAEIEKEHTEIDGVSAHPHPKRSSMLGAGLRAGRSDVTIPTHRLLFLCSQLSGKSHRQFSTWPIRYLQTRHLRSLLKALPSCVATEAAASEAIPTLVESGRWEAGPERRNHPRGRQAPSGDLRNPAVHHEVPV